MTKNVHTTLKRLKLLPYHYQTTISHFVLCEGPDCLLYPHTTSPLHPFLFIIYCVIGILGNENVLWDTGQYLQFWDSKMIHLLKSEL